MHLSHLRTKKKRVTNKASTTVIKVEEAWWLMNVSAYLRITRIVTTALEWVCSLVVHYRLFLGVVSTGYLYLAIISLLGGEI